MTLTRSRALRRSVVVLAVATTAILGLSACAPPASTSTSVGKDGGTLTVAAPGSNKDTLDPNFNPGAEIDLIRSHQLFDNLTSLDPEGNLEYDLAESMDSNDTGTVWTIHLREGVKFHDGTDFGAKDVAATINRIIAPGSTANAQSLLSFIDPSAIKIVDPLTLEITLDTPYGPFPELWTNKYLPIVKDGFDPKEPIGTGPFSFTSFAVGQSSEFARFDDYWGDKAHVDVLKIVDFADDDAAINALKGGQVDISSSVPLPEVASLSKTPGVNILDSNSTSYINIAMNTTVAPFDDPKVREAFRLIVDRDQMVASALGGYGIVGNDYIGGTTNCVPDVPQRTQDIEKAKALLAESGNSDLTVSIATTNGTPGMVEAAEVFAQQAKAAGVTVEVNNLDVTAYLNKYLEWDFAVDFFSDSYLQLASRTLLPGGSSFETHWDNAEFQDLAAQALAETDSDARCGIEKQMKTVEYNEGGNIIWGYYNVINAYADGVSGLQEDIGGTSVYRLNDVTVAQ